MRILPYALLASVLLIPVSAHAQRRGGGGGNIGGGPLGGQPGIGDLQQPNTADVQRRMEERALLGDAVHKVPDLTNAQKDSIKALEKKYGEVFRSYGIAMRSQMDSARSAGGQPDFRAMAMLRMTADSTRDVEVAAARTLLTSDAQRSKFDQNIAEIKERDAKREEAMRNRRAQGMPGGGGYNGSNRGGMGRP
ncbi:MAG: hypothetical protein JF589_10855 [Gemmatimonadetes bacterium]|nr:hypothetical protein [Gemmatimonadota bacterium]